MFRFLVAPLVATAVLAASAGARPGASLGLASYTSARIEVRQAGQAVTIKATQSPDDDPTARVRIFVPSETQLTTTQPPGTVLGPARAVVKALDFGGVDAALVGQLEVAAPGQVSPERQADCLQGVTPIATWVLSLAAAGQTLAFPAYLVAAAGAETVFGVAYIQVCLPPPDVPPGTPGRADFGAKVHTAELTVNGVFSARPISAWIAFWTPYNPGAGTVNVAGTVASPGAVGPGAVSITAKKLGKGAAVAGLVTQAGRPRGGATVTIRGGAKASSLKKLGSVKAAANGTYRFRAKTGTFFSVTAVAAPAALAALCTTYAAALAPVPCVNPTTHGFTADSKTVRKR